jgi:hypothetical protein
MRGREYLRSLTTLRRWVSEDAAARDVDDAGGDDEPGTGGPDDDRRGG